MYRMVVIQILAALTVFASPTPQAATFGAVKTCGNELVFDPPTFSIKDINFQDSFSIKLKSAPQSTVEVRLIGNGIMFNNPTAWFGPRNWSEVID